MKTMSNVISSMFIIFSVSVIIFGICVTCELANSSIINTEYEIHNITKIDFKELSGSYQLPCFTNMKYEYDITVESGEIFSTNLDNFDIGKKYKMKILTLCDDKMSRIIREAIRVGDD